MTYVVASSALELDRGSHFTTLPIAVRPGDLCLFSIGDFLIVGRHYPDVNGSDWIIIPGYLIRITGKTPVRIVGLVLPCPTGAAVCLN